MFEHACTPVTRSCCPGVMSVREPQSHWFERNVLPFAPSVDPKTGETLVPPLYLFKVINLMHVGAPPICLCNAKHAASLCPSPPLPLPAPAFLDPPFTPLPPPS